MYLLYILLIICALINASLSGRGCAIGTYHPEADRCILLMGIDTFYEAEYTCTQMGGHLPSIPNSQFNDNLWNLANDNSPCTRVWIGMDIRQTWFDYSPMNYSGWNAAHPANWTENTCVALTTYDTGESDGPVWNTTNCDLPSTYVCQFDAIDVKVASTLPPIVDNSLRTTKALTTAWMDELACEMYLPSYMGIRRNTRKDIGSFQESNLAPAHLTSKDSNCVIGGKDTSCSSWTVAVFLVFSNSSDALERIQSSLEFVKQVTANCKQKSNLMIVTPGSAMTNSCYYLIASQKNVRSFISQLNINELIVFDEDKNAADVVISMFNTLTECLVYHPVTSAGAVFFFITNLKCEGLCKPDLYAVQSVSLPNLIKEGFMIKFVYNANDSTGLEADCISYVFYACFNYPTTCQLTEVLNGSCTMSQLGTEFTTCAPISPIWYKYNWFGIGFTTVTLIATTIFGLYRLYRKCHYGDPFLPESCCYCCCCCGRNKDKKRILTELSSFKGGHAVANNYLDVNEQATDEWEIQRENIKTLELLGTGAFASVYAGELRGDIPIAKRKDNMKLGLKREANGAFKVAIKKLPPHAASEGRADFLHEIDFMKRLGYHPHIMSLLGCVSALPDSMIVLELCHNGDLLTYIRSKKEMFTKTEEALEPSELRIKDLISLAWQITDGMEYLAAKNFIHRDIAARNVLLTSDLIAKIGDFGLGRLVDTALYNAKGGRLPIKWMAPESLKYYEYSLKSDVWSFGVLLFEVFSLGETPYQLIQPTDMRNYLDKGGRLEQPETCPNEIYEIMSRCWTTESNDRPAIDEIRNDLTRILNTSSENYGYLTMEDREIRLETCPIYTSEKIVDEIDEMQRL